MGFNCYNFCHDNNFGGNAYVSGTTCDGVEAAYYLTLGQCICMDLDFPIITCESPIFSGECAPNVTPTTTPTNTPSNTPTGTPAPTCDVSSFIQGTPTTTPTPTNTPTTTQTPTITPTQNECCDRFTFSGLSASFSAFTGTYVRQQLSGVYYAYVDDQPAFNVACSPLNSIRYTVWENITTGNQTMIFSEQTTTWRIYNSSVSCGIFLSAFTYVNTSNFWTIDDLCLSDDYAIPPEVNDSDFILSYVNCVPPTPTPTASMTPTPSITSSPSNTPSTTPTLTPTTTTTLTTTPTITPTTTQTPTNTPTTTTTLTATPSSTPPNTPTNTPTPTITPSTSFVSGTTEAETYLAAVLAGGGTGITSTISGATITMFRDIMANNLWDKFTAFYPMIGENSGGMKVNGKNPGTNDLTFNGGFTFGASGATGNGTNAYANTGIPQSGLTQNDAHMSIYANIGTSETRIDCGVASASGNSRSLIYTNETTTAGWAMNRANSGYNNWTNTGNTGTGLYVSNRTASNNEEGYRNGIERASGTTASVVSSNNPYIFGGRYGDAGAEAFSARRWCWFSLGKSFTDSEQSTLSTIINTFNTTLSRNTY